jgi:hypothetical protein
MDSVLLRVNSEFILKRAFQAQVKNSGEGGSATHELLNMHRISPHAMNIVNVHSPSSIRIRDIKARMRTKIIYLLNSTNELYKRSRNCQ